MFWGNGLTKQTKSTILTFFGGVFPRKEVRMFKRLFNRSLISFTLILAGCASMGRSCSSWNATNFGADWVVIQMDMNGRPYRCWELHGASITNEQASDGIYWKDPTGGNLMHLSGHYNRVQVVNGDWKSAFAELGLSLDACAQIQALRYNPVLGAYTLPQTPSSDR